MTSCVPVSKGSRQKPTVSVRWTFTLSRLVTEVGLLGNLTQKSLRDERLFILKAVVSSLTQRLTTLLLLGLALWVLTNTAIGVGRTRVTCEL